jgi:hypothetical protein
MVLKTGSRISKFDLFKTLNRKRLRLFRIKYPDRISSYLSLISLDEKMSEYDSIIANHSSFFLNVHFLTAIIFTIN